MVEVVVKNYFTEVVVKNYFKTQLTNSGLYVSSSLKQPQIHTIQSRQKRCVRIPLTFALIVPEPQILPRHALDGNAQAEIQGWVKFKRFTEAKSFLRGAPWMKHNQAIKVQVCCTRVGATYICPAGNHGALLLGGSLPSHHNVRPCDLVKADNTKICLRRKTDVHSVNDSSFQKYCPCC